VENTTSIFRNKEYAKQETNTKQAAHRCCMLQAGLFLGLLFNSENGGNIF
jgi:hypothetical protein